MKVGSRSFESHSRARETFSWSPSGKIIFEFFLQKWRILVYFIFLSDGRAPQALRAPE